MAKDKITNAEKYNNYKNIYDNYIQSYEKGSFYECLLFEYAILEDCTSRILVHLGIVDVTNRTKLENSNIIIEYVQGLLGNKSVNLKSLCCKAELINSVLKSANINQGNQDISDIYADNLATIKHLDEIKKILSHDLFEWIKQRNMIVHNLCNENVEKINEGIKENVDQGKQIIGKLDNFDKAIVRRNVREILRKEGILEELVIENENIILAKDIFFRQIDDSTYVYQTDKQQVYKMSALAYYVLNYYKVKRTTSLIKYITKEISTQLNKENIYELNDFVKELVDNEVLLLPYENDKPNETEEELKLDISAKKHLLNNAMFELTYRCTERCVHCYCVTDKSEGELKTEKIKSLIDELKEMNTMELTFTGGELFVRKDAFEILEYAYSKNFLINIFTNGTCLNDDDLFRLQRIHPKSVSLSLYDVLPEKHDAFTTLKGSYKKTTDVIRKLIALGIKVNVKTNVTADNIDRLQDFVKMVKEMGANLEVGLSFTPKNDGNMEPTRFRLNSIEMYQKALKTVFPYLTEESEIRINNNLTNRKICWAGENGISINPYGKVFACNALMISIGDVNNQTIKEIWEKSLELKRIRKFNMNMVSCAEECKYAQLCAFCPGTALTEGNDPLKCYEEACNITKAQIGLRKE